MHNFAEPPLFTPWSDKSLIELMFLASSVSAGSQYLFANDLHSMPISLTGPNNPAPSPTAAARALRQSDVDDVAVEWDRQSPAR